MCYPKVYIKQTLFPVGTPHSQGCNIQQLKIHEYSNKIGDFLFLKLRSVYMVCNFVYIMNKIDNLRKKLIRYVTATFILNCVPTFVLFGMWQVTYLLTYLLLHSYNCCTTTNASCQFDQKYLDIIVLNFCQTAPWCGLFVQIFRGLQRFKVVTTFISSIFGFNKVGLWPMGGQTKINKRMDTLVEIMI